MKILLFEKCICGVHENRSCVEYGLWITYSIHYSLADTHLSFSFIHYIPYHLISDNTHEHNSGPSILTMDSLNMIGCCVPVGWQIKKFTYGVGRPL